MKDVKKKTAKDNIAFFLLMAIIFGGVIYYFYFLAPKNSVELYQEFRFADDFDEAQKQVLEGYENNFTQEEFDFIQENNPDTIKQVTLFEYNQQTHVIMTSPGTEKLKVLDVEEMPEEAREFFLELGQ